MNNPNYLDFEQQVAELDDKIRGLGLISDGELIKINEEIASLKDKKQKLTQKIYGNLSITQISQVSRHPLRPYTLDYIPLIFTDFIELAGDRYFGNDKAIISGFAKIEGKPIAIIGHQKGREVNEKVLHNFGMPKPEGFRKAIRIMKLAEKYKVPIITFIDTPGAYPGIEAENRGQSEAIAQNLAQMMLLEVPVISCVIGEGGSGGALAIGVCDKLLMLEYSTYSVISPEGCASILWKSGDYVGEAATAMKINSKNLQELKLVDEVIKEPIGGAHRDYKEVASSIKNSLINHINEMSNYTPANLVRTRTKKWSEFALYSE